MNSKKILLKTEINTLCTLRCENMRAIYEHQDNSEWEKKIAKQEKYVNTLIDDLGE